MKLCANPAPSETHARAPIADRVFHTAPIGGLAWLHLLAARLGLPGPAPLDAQEPEFQSILERDLSEEINALLGGGDARIRVTGAWGRPDYDLIAIAQAAERFGADVVCLGTHRRSRHEVAMGNSVIQTVVRRSTRPWLVAPESPE